jgi:hypothetical protein
MRETLIHEARAKGLGWHLGGIKISKSWMNIIVSQAWLKRWLCMWIGIIFLKLTISSGTIDRIVKSK